MKLRYITDETRFQLSGILKESILRLTDFLMQTGKNILICEVLCCDAYKDVAMIWLNGENEKPFLVCGDGTFIGYCQMSSLGALHSADIISSALPVLHDKINHTQLSDIFGYFNNARDINDEFARLLNNCELCWWKDIVNNHLVNQLFLLPSCDLVYYNKLDKAHKRNFLKVFEKAYSKDRRLVGPIKDIETCLTNEFLNLMVEIE